MNKIFDFEHERDLLRGPVGVDYYRAKSLEESASNRAISRTAGFMLNTATNCVLVGFNDEARQLLRMTKEWLEYAIGTQEQPRNYFPGGTEAIRHENLALCNWLLSDSHDRENLAAAIRFESMYNAESRQSKESISIVLPVYVDAGEYGMVISLHEQYWGQKKQANVRRIRREASMSYMIAIARLHHEYSEEDLTAAAEYFLRAQVLNFLDQGGYTYMIRWLKILHWNDNPDRRSAFETVRKCYDYLPNVARPNFA